MDILIRELSAFYQSFSNCQLPTANRELPPLPLQFADFAHWQRRWMESPELDRQCEYWQGQLKGAPSSANLPADRPPCKQLSFRGGAVSFQVESEVLQKLKALSRQSGATLYMTLLSAFNLLLFRWGGQPDLTVGSPIANRTWRETEALVGFFVNTLVMRTDLSGNPTFLQLLQRVRRTALDAYAHQDIPFEQVVEAVQPQRRLHSTPLFQSMFVFQNAPLAEFQMPGLAINLLPVASGTAKFDLTLSMHESPQGLSGELEYSKELFNPSTVLRMASQIGVLLDDISSNPECTLQDFELLSASQRHQLVAEWNQTRSALPSQQCIHQIFAAQALQRPDSVALALDEAQLSYLELDRRSLRLANALARRGAGPDQLTAICLQRSLEMVIGLLGILRTGAAYLPLDPDYPSQRLRFMLRDSGARLLLTRPAMSDRLELEGTEVVHPEAGRSEQELEVALTADQMAYVIYTSGSTGTPKGSAIPHKGVVRLVRSANYVRLTSGDVFLQLATLSFDASAFEIWGALLNGARLVMMPPRPPALREISRVLRCHSVTVLWLTSGLFRLMAQEQLAALARVPQLLAGGDVLPVDSVRRLLQIPGRRTVINGYGPTENSTFSCCHPMASPGQFEGTVPIGRPISNSQAYLLDSSMRTVPIGVAGELCAGGEGLARGYLRRPGWTAERFVPDPFSPLPGQRLYRTGDRARSFPDGVIEFLGRWDQQVKLRGFRVELGEVEAVLERHPEVQEAAAVVRGERLIAYVSVGRSEKRVRSSQFAVGSSEEETGREKEEQGAKGKARSSEYSRSPISDSRLPVPDSSSSATSSLSDSLQIFIKQHLPAYLQPSAIIFLEAFPQTPSGKLDRQRLPDPGESMSTGRPVKPRTQMERLIASLWQETLQHERIGIDDNFFDLGGHSLALIQLHERLCRALGRDDLSMVKLFEHTTIAALASYLEDAPPESPDRSGQRGEARRLAMLRTRAQRSSRQAGRT